MTSDETETGVGMEERKREINAFTYIDHLTGVVGREEWFNLIRQGYVGLQSGNTDRIYFSEVEAPEGDIIAGSIFNGVDKIKFETLRYHTLVDNLRAMRRYWVCKPELLHTPIIVKAILQKQNFIQSRKKLFNLLRPELKFSGELL